MPNYHRCLYRSTLNSCPRLIMVSSKQLARGTGPQPTLRDAGLGRPGRLWQGHSRPTPPPFLLMDSQPPAPGRGSAWQGKQTHLPHLSPSVYFEFVFPLTDFPFSLGFKNHFLSEYRRSQQSQHHGSYGMHLERGEKKTRTGWLYDFELAWTWRGWNFRAGFCLHSS